MTPDFTSPDYPTCPACRNRRMGINPRRIGEYMCYRCGHRHFEDINDESTWLPRKASDGRKPDDSMDETGPSRQKELFL